MTFKLKGLIPIIILMIISSCKTEISRSTGICVLIDVTDSTFNSSGFLPDNVQAILKLMDLDKEKGGFSGGEVRFSLINDISDSKSEKVVLDKAKSGLLGQNPLIRKDEVEEFYTNLESVFAKTIDQANWGTDESKIYQKITRELTKLHGSEFDRKIMIIYSDMLENSNLFSFYTPHYKTDIEKYINNPENAIKEFSKAGPNFPNLNDFEIFIITNRTSYNDEKINLSEKFWTSIFNSAGATVTFDSVLDY